MTWNPKQRVYGGSGATIDPGEVRSTVQDSFERILHRLKHLVIVNKKQPG
jgi:hypothetical protein